MVVAQSVERDKAKEDHRKNSETGTYAGVTNTANQILDSGDVKIFNRNIYVKRDGIWTVDNLALRHKLNSLWRNCTRHDEMEVINKLLGITGGGDDLEVDKHHINFANGKYNLADKTLRGYTDEDIIFTRFNCEYHKDAPSDCAVVDDFISYLVCGNKDEARMIWEMIGYVLTPTNAKQKAFLLVGEGGTGKSVLLKLLEKLIGKDHTKAASIQDLNSYNTLASLYGKQLCIMDESDGYVKDITGFKIASSGGRLKARFLYQEEFDFHFEGKIVMSGNRVPKFFDTGGAIFRRVIVIPCAAQTIPERERIDYLEDVLYENRDYIVKKAIDTYQEMRERKEFTRSARSLELSKEGVIENNPWMEFIEGLSCGQLEGHPKSEIYEQYKKWANDNGFKPLSSASFGAKMKLVFDFETGRKMVCNNYERVYQNVSRKTGVDPSEEERMDLEPVTPF
jgi:putative DNA primase/helicase